MNDDSRNPLSDPIFRRISRLADAMGVRAYVVGGYVRDYYLGRPSTDIDVVVVGSGIAVAEALAAELHTRLSVFKTFGTAMLRTGGMEVEFVGARKESYSADSRKPASWSIRSRGCAICASGSSARRATPTSPFRTIRCA